MASLDLPRHPESSARACDAVEAQALAAGWSAADASRVSLAVGEAVANAVEHGPPAADAPIALRSRFVGDALVVRVGDGGRGPSVADIEGAELPADPLAVGGRGLYILRQLTDGVEHDGGRLVLTFRART